MSFYTRKSIGADDDLFAAETRYLAWLLSAKKFQQAAIARDGFPVPLVAPDPRLFALHKLWLAEQPEREPGTAVTVRVRCLREVAPAGAHQFTAVTGLSTSSEKVAQCAALGIDLFRAGAQSIPGNRHCDVLQRSRTRAFPCGVRKL